MKKRKSYLFILGLFVLICLLPVGGAYLSRGGMPGGYGFFPARLMEDPPGFSGSYFVAFSLFALMITLFLLFPRLFGFKGRAAGRGESGMNRASFPPWFYPSLAVTVVFWILMWGRFKVLYPVEHYSFVPLAWGFILVLDGIVYRRSGGRSLFAVKRNQFKLMIIVSALSWFLFEYLNFFVLENWYYPNYDVFTNFGNILWFTLGYTTILPVIFEWYTLLRTFPRLGDRYAGGPRLEAKGWIKIPVLILGLSLFVLMNFFPYPLFWAVWVALIPVFGAGLSLVGRRTVLSGIGEGDWSQTVLIALATLLNGFVWELWNFGSEWFHGFYPTTPGFWMYSVPYVDVIHIFSEMPLLGYYGYLFFGVNCWILWNLSAFLLNFDDTID